MANTKITLGIKERIGLIRILPPNEDRAGYKLVRLIASKADIFEQEATDINLRMNQKRYLWDQDKAQDKEIEFTPEELQMIGEAAKQMDLNKWVTDENFDIVDFILENYPPQEKPAKDLPLPPNEENL